MPNYTLIREINKNTREISQASQFSDSDQNTNLLPQKLCEKCCLSHHQKECLKQINRNNQYSRDLEKSSDTHNQSNRSHILQLVNNTQNFLQRLESQKNVYEKLSLGNSYNLAEYICAQRLVNMVKLGQEVDNLYIRKNCDCVDTRDFTQLQIPEKEVSLNHIQEEILCILEQRLFPKTFKYETCKLIYEKINSLYKTKPLDAIIVMIPYYCKRKKLLTLQNLNKYYIPTNTFCVQSNYTKGKLNYSVNDAKKYLFTCVDKVDFNSDRCMFIFFDYNHFDEKMQMCKLLSKTDVHVLFYDSVEENTKFPFGCYEFSVRSYTNKNFIDLVVDEKNTYGLIETNCYTIVQELSKLSDKISEAIGLAKKETSVSQRPKKRKNNQTDTRDTVKKKKNTVQEDTYSEANFLNNQYFYELQNLESPQVYDLNQELDFLLNTSAQEQEKEVLNSEFQEKILDSIISYKENNDQCQINNNIASIGLFVQETRDKQTVSEEELQNLHSSERVATTEHLQKFSSANFNCHKDIKKINNYRDNYLDKKLKEIKDDYLDRKLREIKKIISRRFYKEKSNKLYDAERMLATGVFNDSAFCAKYQPELLYTINKTIKDTIKNLGIDKDVILENIIRSAIVLAPKKHYISYKDNENTKSSKKSDLLTVTLKRYHCAVLKRTKTSDIYNEQNDNSKIVVGLTTPISFDEKDNQIFLFVKKGFNYHTQPLFDPNKFTISAHFYDDVINHSTDAGYPLYEFRLPQDYNADYKQMDYNRRNYLDNITNIHSMTIEEYITKAYKILDVRAINSIIELQFLLSVFG